MHSCLYRGAVRHRRHMPLEHQFRYTLFQVYLDLAELETVFAKRWLWSVERRNVASFRRADHLGNPAQPLDLAVRDLVAAETGRRPEGPIRLLTHLRYFGVAMNPVSFYFCFDGADHFVEHVILEVHNTPWKERHCYVQTLAEPGAARHDFRFTKAFHVSPFMEMAMEYRCVLQTPGEHLSIHLENWRDGAKLFDATLQLRREALSGLSLCRVLLRYPLMTTKVLAAIYWQALRLWWRGVAYVPHPQYPTTKETHAHE